MRNQFDAILFCTTARVWRRMHGFTQADMAAACGVSTSKLSLIESGDVPPTIAELARFCDFMDESVVTFFKMSEKGNHGRN